MNSNKLFFRKRLVFEKVRVEKIFFKHYFLEKKKTLSSQMSRPSNSSSSSRSSRSPSSSWICRYISGDRMKSETVIWPARDFHHSEDRNLLSPSTQVSLSLSLSLSVNPCMQFLFLCLCFCSEICCSFFSFLDEKYVGEIVC